MKGKAYITVSASVFAVVAFGHLARAFLRLPVEVVGIAIPVWLSWVGFAGAGTLSIWGFCVVANRPRNASREGGEAVNANPDRMKSLGILLLGLGVLLIGISTLVWTIRRPCGWSSLSIAGGSPSSNALSAALGSGSTNEESSATLTQQLEEMKKQLKSLGFDDDMMEKVMDFQKVDEKVVRKPIQ